MIHRSKSTLIDVAAATFVCLVLTASSMRAQIIRDDDYGVRAAEDLVVMIDGRFNQPTQGAGIVFAVDGGYAYIVTVYHVVRNSEDRTASDLKVRFHSDPQHDVNAEYLRSDSGKELAVLRVKVAGGSFNFARLGDMERIKNGLPAYAIGQPGKDWGVTYTPGSISDVLAARLEVQSAYIQHGHSGGALIDQQGRIIGIVNDTDGFTAGAVRIDHVLNVLRLDLKLPVQLTAEGASPPVAGERRVNPKDGLNYRWIPPGIFWMGCPQPKDSDCNENDEFPTHEVTITKGFWMGETEVTQEAYTRVTGAPNPSHFKGPRLPVESVSWDEAKAYCMAAGGMRLPTEAEWEYAARAGTRASVYGDLNSVAWYSANSNNQTHEVGLKAPNAWNLRDMLGNVWEWVADWYDAGYYENSPSADPKGPGAKQYYVLRGGAWGIAADSIRASFRGWSEAASPSNNLGFRCAGELR